MATQQELFAGDALNRVNFATNLSTLICKLKGGVIAIDGEWGSGKSWFGKRIASLLKEEHHLTSIWFDTFAADWHDDPALSLLAEFAEQLPADKRQKFNDSVAPLAGKLAMAGMKAGLQAVGNLIGVDEKTASQVIDVVQGTGEAYVKKRLNELGERKKSLETLKELLQKAVNDCGGKIVIFVDELDRCSPAYAIRFLERAKHLFDVEGVVFVLLWNRDQIQHAVRSFYGQQTDGQMYLDRFVDYPFHLPNHHLHGRAEAMGLIVGAEIAKLAGKQQVQLHEIARIMGFFADVLALTAREVKHVCAWWVLSNGRSDEVLEAWLNCLKVKRPDIYAGLRVESTNAHGAAEVLMFAAPKSPVYDDLAKAIVKFHQMCKSGDTSSLGNELNLLFGQGRPNVLSIASSTIQRIEALKP